jgi:FemAB-related protein (PEP-CTERM system-associated)
MEASAALVDRPAHAAQTVSVRDFRADDAQRWDAYVERCAAATFFHRIGWRAIVEDVFRHRAHYLVAERDGAIAGVLPLAEAKTLIGGHALVSLPFAVYGGPAADDAIAERALIDAAAERARSLGVEYLELRNVVSRCAGWPVQGLYATFRRDIAPDAEANLQAIPRKQRAMVRKGIKHGLASEIDRSSDRFFTLYADNMHRHGTPPLPARYFERLAATFGDACEVLTVVDAGGKPVSGVMSFYFRDTVLPYYAGDTVAARDLAANDFKYWELMRRAAAKGIRVFDYGRSKRGTGAFDFKKNWGFEPSPLAYEYLLLTRDAIPQNNPANPKYRTLIAVWKRLPIAVANRLGPLIVRGLG